MRPFLLLLLLATLNARGAGFGSSFTFQGRLTGTNGPAQGAHDLEFWLWDRVAGGHFLGAVTNSDYPVSNGLFTASLDYGTNAIAAGAPLFVEIWVRRSGDTNDPVALSPRTPLTPAPYAVLAGDVPDGSIGSAKIASGAIGAAQIASGAITATHLAVGAVTGSAIAPGTIQGSHIAAGAITATNLAAGAVTAPAIAAGAVNGLHITNGAIGSLQLAANSISSSKIADGSITAADLAPGSIGETQLVRPYRAGLLAFGDTWIFPTMVVTQAFAPPFASEPVITANLDPTDADDPDRVMNLRVSQRSASGFVARIVSPQVVAHLQDSFDSPFDVPSLVEVGSGTNARPAIAGIKQPTFDKSYFWMAPLSMTDTWQSVLIASNCDVPIAATDSGGWPAVVMFHTLQWQLRFARASNELGTSWGGLMAPDNATTNVTSYRPLHVQNLPAIVYQGEVGGVQRFRYVRAGDTNGTSWATPVTLKSGATGAVFAVTVVQGNPAALLAITNGLHYVRASDNLGSAWPTPSVLVTQAVDYASCQIINGRPAIGYHVAGDTNIWFLRAADDTGSAWLAPVSAAIISTIGIPRPDLLVANGRPLLVFADYTEIRAVEALNADGTLWDAARTFSPTLVGSPPRKATAIRHAGGLAVFMDKNSGADSYLVWSGGPPPASLQWTTVQP